MRRCIVVGWSVILLAGLVGPVSAQSIETQTVSVAAESYAIVSEAAGQQPSVEGFGYLMIPGQPRLPARIFAIAIPPGAEVIDVAYDGAEVVLPGKFDIAPAILPRVIGDEDPLIAAAERRRYEENHAAVYGRDDVFPARPVELVRTAGYREYNLVDVRVTPFAYRPASGVLAHYPCITVQVRYRMPATARDVVVNSSRQIDRVARDIVLNYDEAKSWYQSDRQQRGLYDFVIITLDSLTSAVTPLVDWEIAKGRTVQVVTTTWINTSYTGYDLAEKMRNFLRDKYPADQWGIEDVLLVGNRANLPMRRTTQDLGYGSPETDFYFAELSLPDNQSWDSDGDHKWGENSDPIDFYNEVNVGRIPWSDAATVLSICNKSVAFEQNTDPGYKKNMLLLGGFFWEDTDNAVLMETKINQPWMADWTFTRMYEYNSTVQSTYSFDYELTHSNVQSVWPGGTYAFVNWAGHGSPTSAHIMGYGSEAFIASSDCALLNNSDSAIIFADACSNSDTDYTNIGQSMLQRGAVGFLGATKVALGAPAWDGPYAGSSQSLDYFFTTFVTSGEYTQGAAHQAALREMYTHGLWSYVKYETFEWGALWGNPDLAIASPAPLSISFPNGLPEHLTPGVAQEASVLISNGIEDYVPGSATLYRRYDGGLWQTAPLTHDGGNLYVATLPPAACADTPEYYFSAGGDGGATVYAPYGAPGSSYSAVVGARAVFFEDAFDANPGWTLQTQWAFGQPTGGGGEYGGPDPSSGHTGINVYGYNLSGDYANNLAEKHLTSVAIDCTGLTDVHLSFWRWLGVEQPSYDHAYVRVSNNGSTWTTVWQNGAEIADTAWQLMDLDISAVADNQPTVYLRWTMGTTDTGWRYCGWNIDDVSLSAFQCVFTWQAGDVNCDGEVDFGDINPFVLYLSNPSAWQAAYPTCPATNGDINGDGTYPSFSDINPFVTLLTRG